MSNTVQAIVRQVAPLREERVKINNTINFPGQFKHAVNGAQKAFRFKNADGSSVETFPIPNAKSFNLDNEVDKHNWNTLKMFLTAYPQFGNDVTLYDPVTEANSILAMQDLSLEIETDIVKNKANTEWLTKLYRRVIKHATGVTDNQILKELREKARENPLAFQIDGGLVYKDDSFEQLALIDIGLEKGFFVKDVDGQLLRRGGSVYAENIQKALFRFINDPDTQELLKIEVSAKGGVQVQEKYVPKIENYELVNLANMVGEDVASEQINDDFSINEEEKILRFEKELDENIPKLIEQGFIEKNGPSWLRIQNLDKNFRMADLAPYFKMNPAQYEEMKLRAKL